MLDYEDNNRKAAMENTFHPLPLLPAELRPQIWLLTLHHPTFSPPAHPAAVELAGPASPKLAELTTKLVYVRKANARSGDGSIPSKRRIPAVLHVCQEKREEILGTVYLPVVFFHDCQPFFLTKRETLYGELLLVGKLTLNPKFDWLTAN